MSENITIKKVNDVSESTSSIQRTQRVRDTEAHDSEHFQRMLKRKHEEKKEEGPLPTLISPLDPTMREVLIQPTLPNAIAATNQATTAEVRASDATTLAQLTELIASHVEKTAVSTNQHNEKVMHVFLKDTLLPQTEITINASNHQLVVQFITSSGKADQWLNQQRSTLQSTLADRLERPVHLTVQLNEQQHDATQERHDA